MNKILAFDTETTGLMNWTLPATHEWQPKLVQLACVLVDEQDWKEHAAMVFVVKPEGWEVPRAASDTHGITTEDALAVGIPEIVALSAFSWLAKQADICVAHNSEFDMAILAGAFNRVKRPMPPMNVVDTVALAAPIVNLPPTERMIAAGFGSKPKNPNLGECVRFFFGEELAGAHDALVDTRACLRVYRAMKVGVGFPPGVPLVAPITILPHEREERIAAMRSVEKCAVSAPSGELSELTLANTESSFVSNLSSKAVYPMWSIASALASSDGWSLKKLLHRVARATPFRFRP